MASPTIFEQIFAHPDVDEIISKLMSGINAEDIYEWLKLKYPLPEEKKFVFNEKQLENFKDNHLNAYKTMLKHISQTKLAKTDDTVEIDKFVQNNPSYQKKLNEMIDYKLDIKQMICNFLVKAEYRMDQIFDLIQENPKSWKADRVFIEWLGQFSNMMEMYYKHVEEVPDQVIQHNVSVEVVDQYANTIIDTFREIINELDTPTALLITEKLSNKLSRLKPGAKAPEIQTIKDIKLEHEHISAKLLS
jgi:hypothetical protein